MKRPLNVLIVEDSEDDALLLVRELRHSGYEPVHARVDTASTMSMALDANKWDVVISDYGMPQFDGRQALALVRGRGLDIPFIIVSGTIGEDTAVEAMRAGANDYILKSNRTRLPTVLERELREARIRSERRRIEDHLALSDRLASIGTLAAGVAHEINNPLATIILSLEHVTSEVGRWSAGGASVTTHEMLRSINGPLHDARLSAERVRRIVRDLGTFSRADDDKKAPVDLVEIIELTTRIAANEVKRRARVVRDFAKIPPFLGNEARIGQVVLNLLLNAAQAIPEGRPEANEIRIATGLGSRERVIIEISDTGVGIPKEVAGRIFDPFFTTKPIGMGTGLGLAVTHRIVTSMGGRIHFETRPEGGTTFRVSLPFEPARARRVLRDPSPSASTERGRVLVIDDEKMLLGVVRRILVPHDVVTAESAQEGLALLRSGERFDLILCDLMMPGRTGMDFHSELRAFAPDVAEQVVFMTGGVFTPEARAFLDSVENERVEKPLSIEALRKLASERVRAVDRMA